MIVVFAAAAISNISLANALAPSHAILEPDTFEPPVLYDNNSNTIVSYQPTLSVWSVPAAFVSNINFTVFAHVEDKFGEIQIANLIYSVNNGEKHNSLMKLIHGTPNNGTYAASIPSQPPGSLVNIELYLRDNLGYEVNYHAEPLSVIEDTEAPRLDCFMVNELNSVLRRASPWEYVRIRCEIRDSESGIAQTSFIENNITGTMHQVATLKTMLGGIYESDSLPPGKPSSNRTFVVTAVDYAGKKNSIPISIRYSDTTQEQYIDVKVRVSSVDTTNMEVNAEFRADGKIALRQAEEAVLNVRSVVDGQEKYSFFSVFLGPSSEPQQLSTSALLELEGQPRLYPFDNYNASATIRVPFTNITNVGLQPEYEEDVKNYWRTSFQPGKPYFERGYTLHPIKLTFHRTEYVAAGIYLPLFAIFFLLGAIFVIKKHPNHLTNKLGISIGVFAFIFSFTAVIDALKPSTFGIPTIADVMIFSAAIATIIYTVGGVFETHYRNKHIDKIAFIAALIPIVVIFLSQSYPIEMVVPILIAIIVGLGYGVLVRGLKESTIPED